MSFNSGSPSATSQLASENLGTPTSTSAATGVTNQTTQAGGTIGNKGVNGGTLSAAVKQYAKSLTVKIDGTDVTSNILTATGWAAIGDGSAGHAFHSAGTGELDASAYKSYSPGVHTIEIIEPQSGYGTSFMVHVETS